MERFFLVNSVLKAWTFMSNITISVWSTVFTINSSKFSWILISLYFLCHFSTFWMHFIVIEILIASSEDILTEFFTLFNISGELRIFEFQTAILRVESDVYDVFSSFLKNFTLSLNNIVILLNESGAINRHLFFDSNHPLNSLWSM